MTTTTTPTETTPTTPDDAPVTIPVRLDIQQAAPGFSAAMNRLHRAAEAELDRVGFDARLRDLVRLRASQLNGCAYCVDLHTTDALAAGEHPQRVTAVPVWREAPFFTARERAALDLTEQVTLLAQTHVPDEVWQEAARHFTPDELGALVAALTTINAWNTINVTTRTWNPTLHD
ncbi:carboxymuconolactone decarboxylase family protein [Luteimicrobium sp. NPDC057192]|uniref:carboxymuconolactone decarboxylase family protein n=1 Tax=Luteimicrobium sp. NPDC057192 TaxID=3346042 RepID=UPI003640E9BF